MDSCPLRRHHGSRMVTRTMAMRLLLCSLILCSSLQICLSSTEDHVARCNGKPIGEPWFDRERCEHCTCSEDGILSCNKDLCRTCVVVREQEYGEEASSHCCPKCKSQTDVESIRRRVPEGESQAQKAEDCPLQGWSPWSPCSVTCGKGVQMSSAVVLLPTQTNDRRCIRQEKTKRCAVNKECSNEVECKEKGWSHWSACSATCRGGIRHRSRILKRISNDGFITCSNEIGQMACNDQTTCKKVATAPTRISGVVSGTINGILIPRGQYAGQNAHERGTMATMGGIPKNLIPGLSPLLPMMWPVYWLTMVVPSSTPGYASGFELSAGQFQARGTFEFHGSSTKRLTVTYSGVGLDHYGQARIDIHLNGSVPEVAAGRVKIGDFMERYTWTSDKKLTMKTSSTATVSGKPVNFDFHLFATSANFDNIDITKVHNKQLIVTVGGIRQFNRVSVGQLYFMMRTKAEVLTVPSPGTADVAAAEAGIHVSRPTAQSSTTEAEIEHVVTEELGNRPDDFVHATTVQNELAQTHMATTPGVTALKGNENNTEVLATTLESQSTTITTPSTVPTTTASTTKIATIPVPLTTVSTTETSTVPILPTTVSETSLQATVTSAIQEKCESLLTTPCRFEGRCQYIAANDTAQCSCAHIDCRASAGKHAHSRVCGSDGVTYAGGCNLLLASCRKQTQITVKKRKACPEPPTIYSHPHSFVRVKHGRKFFLKCRVRGTQPMRVKWIKDGKALRTNKRMTISSYNRLSIKKARPSDNGRYVCLAINSFGQDQVVITLEVRGKRAPHTRPVRPPRTTRPTLVASSASVPFAFRTTSHSNIHTPAATTELPSASTVPVVNTEAAADSTAIESTMAVAKEEPAVPPLASTDGIQATEIVTTATEVASTSKKPTYTSPRVSSTPAVETLAHEPLSVLAHMDLSTTVHSHSTASVKTATDAPYEPSQDLPTESRSASTTRSSNQPTAVTETTLPGPMAAPTTLSPTPAQEEDTVPLATQSTMDMGGDGISSAELDSTIKPADHTTLSDLIEKNGPDVAVSTTTARQAVTYSALPATRTPALNITTLDGHLVVSSGGHHDQFTTRMYTASLTTVSAKHPATTTPPTATTMPTTPPPIATTTKTTSPPPPTTTKTTSPPPTTTKTTSPPTATTTKTTSPPPTTTTPSTSRAFILTTIPRNKTGVYIQNTNNSEEDASMSHSGSGLEVLTAPQQAGTSVAPSQATDASPATTATLEDLPSTTPALAARHDAHQGTTQVSRESTTPSAVTTPTILQDGGSGQTVQTESRKPAEKTTHSIMETTSSRPTTGPAMTTATFSSETVSTLLASSQALPATASPTQVSNAPAATASPTAADSATLQTADLDPTTESYTEAGTILATELVTTATSALADKTTTPKVAPEFTQRPRRMMARQGDTVMFFCNAVGNPAPKITWSGPSDRAGKVSHRTSGRTIFWDSGDLELETVTPSDNGLYTCTATNSQGSISHVAKLKVFVTAYILPGTPSQVTLMEGQSALVSCTAGGDPAPEITWQQPTVVLAAHTSHIRLLENGSMFWQHARSADTGMYTCTASNMAGQDSKVINITVVARKDPPSFLERPSNVTVLTGASVEFRCVPDAGQQGSVDIAWRHAGPPANTNSTVLSIQHARPEDSGVVVCTLRNSYGTASSYASLTVYDNLQVSAARSNMVAVVNSSARIEFSITPDTNAADIQCTFNNQTLRKDTVRVHDNLVAIVIPVVSLDSSGSYVCTASNPAISMKASVELTAHERPYFTLKPSNKVAALGTAVSLACTASGSPEPAIHWTIHTPSGKLNLSHADRQQHVASRLGQLAATAFVADNGTLHLTNVRGEFHTATRESLSQRLLKVTCHAGNAVGRIHSLATIDILAAPMASLSSNATSVPFGGNAILTCTATGSPRPTVTWLRNSVLASDMAIMSHTSPGEVSSVLHLDNATEALSGHYTCQAENSVGVNLAVAFLSLQVTVPVFLQSPQNRTLFPGQSTVLDCVITGYPRPKTTWLHNGRQVSDDGVLVNGSLSLTDFHRSMSGVYTCLAENSAGSVYQSAHITYGAVATASTHGQRQLVLPVGSQISLYCRGHGVPEPSLKWILPGGREANRGYDDVTGDIVVTQSAASLVLRILHAHRNHSGTYACAAGNQYGTDTRHYSIVVKDVTIQDEEVQQTAQRGSQHTFHCSTRARFAPPVAWYVSGEEINSTTAASMYGMQLSSASLFNSTSGSLTVRNVEYQSPDRYVCIVAGNDTTVMIRRRFHLSVHGPPVLSTGRDSTTSSMLATVGASALLHCPLTSHPAARITWYHGHRAVGQSSGTGVSVRGNGSLSISPVLKSHNGDYRCVATNQYGTAEANTVLQVTEPVKVTIVEHAAMYLKGQTVHLHCLASGFPRPTVAWKKNGSPISATTSTLLLNGHLIMLNGTSQQSGAYTCLASNNATKQVAVTQVMILDLPRITNWQSNNIVEVVPAEGRVLLCNASGLPTPAVQWLLDGQPIGHGGLLKLDTTTSSMDAGFFTNGSVLLKCSASNDAGVSDVSVQVHVLSPPAFKVPHENVSVLLSTPSTGATLSCAVSGYPVPTVTWLHNGVRLSGHGVRQNGRKSRLALHGVSRRMAGRYTCVAYNRVGIAVATRNLQVNEMPRATLNVTKVAVSAGKTIDIGCQTLGFPYPNITWLFDGQAVEAAMANTQNSFSVDGGHLHLTSLHSNMAGEYSCVAANEFGVATASASLEVLDMSPTIGSLRNMTATDGTSVTIECSVSSQDTAVAWSFQGKVLSGNSSGATWNILPGNMLQLLRVGPWWSGIFTCSAKNKFGSASRSMHLTVEAASIVLQAPRNTTALRGSVVKFPCLVKQAQVPAMATFSVNSVLIENSLSYALLESSVHGGLMLHVDTTRLPSSTAILCEGPGFRLPATLHIADVAASTRVSVHSSHSGRLAVGGTSMLQCTTDSMVSGVFANGEQHVSWYRDGHHIPLADSVHAMKRPEGAQLEIKANRSDGIATFTCVVENAGKVANASITIAFMARPRFRRVSQNAEVSNRQRALLLCRLPRELSDIVVKWTKLPNTPVYPGPRYWVTKSKALRFYANQKTAGVYQCSATVGGVNITHNAMIAIKGSATRPIMVQSPKSQTVKLGNSVDLHCRGLATPMPKVHWLKNGMEVIENENIVVSGHRLRIRSASRADAANFTCTVFNEAGAVTSTAEIRVLDTGSGVCQTEAGEISSGSSWLQKETCSVCSCDLTGQVTCSPLQCARLNCSDTVQMAGTCCPVCRVCPLKVGGVGPDVCHASSCSGLGCAAYPNAECSIPQCGPDCTPKFTVSGHEVNCSLPTTCKDDQGISRPVGSGWTNSLCTHSCNCTLGGVSVCQSLQCPACAVGSAVVVDGQCCPVCRQGWSTCMVSPWSSWSPCNASCGSAVQTRSRHMTRPRNYQTDADVSCQGSIVESKNCHLQPCQTGSPPQDKPVSHIATELLTTAITKATTATVPARGVNPEREGLENEEHAKSTSTDLQSEGNPVRKPQLEKPEDNGITDNMEVMTQDKSQPGHVSEQPMDTLQRPGSGITPVTVDVETSYRPNTSPTVKCRYNNRRLKVIQWYHGVPGQLTPLVPDKKLTLTARHKFLKARKLGVQDSGLVFTCLGRTPSGTEHFVSTRLTVRS